MLRLLHPQQPAPWRPPAKPNSKESTQPDTPMPLRIHKSGCSFIRPSIRPRVGRVSAMDTPRLPTVNATATETNPLTAPRLAKARPLRGGARRGAGAGSVLNLSFARLRTVKNPSLTSRGNRMATQTSPRAVRTGHRLIRTHGINLASIASAPTGGTGSVRRVLCASRYITQNADCAFQ